MTDSEMCLEAARKTFPNNEELRVAYMLGFGDGCDKASLQPSLPSNIDEAAQKVEDYYDVGDEHRYLCCHRGDIKDAFKAGAQYAAPRWISVDEKLPEMDEDVIVLTDELGTAPIYKIAFGHIVDVERCIDYNGWNCPGVKFWMPCPKIPNE